MNDILFNIGSVNPSGIGDEVYFIPKKYIKGWPFIEDDFERYITTGHYAEYDGSFQLFSGCYWTRLYSTQGKGKISWDFVGEADCKVVVNKASLSYPKLNTEITAFSKFSSNGDFSSS